MKLDIPIEEQIKGIEAATCSKVPNDAATAAAIELQDHNYISSAHAIEGQARIIREKFAPIITQLFQRISELENDLIGANLSGDPSKWRPTIQQMVELEDERDIAEKQLAKLVQSCTPMAIPSDKGFPGTRAPDKELLEECREFVCARKRK